MTATPSSTARPAARFTVSTDGQHEIQTRATDLAGNTSAWKIQTLKVDQTLPEVTTTVPAAWTHTRTVTLSASDATSGVARSSTRSTTSPP